MFADPSAGLATVEALYAALRLMGKADVSILLGYHFARKFLEQNAWLEDLNQFDIFAAEKLAGEEKINS